MSGVSASPPCHSFQSIPSKFTSKHKLGLVTNPHISGISSDINLKTQLGLRFRTASRQIIKRCRSSTGPGGPASGDSESRSILDAFFLGKALAEALNERVESAVGEFLSTIGRLQAEQQKQIQNFQDDVLERAKKAKEQAAREATEAQGIIPRPSTVVTKSVNHDVSYAPSASFANSAKTGSSPATEDPVLGVSGDDD